MERPTVAANDGSMQRRTILSVLVLSAQFATIMVPQRPAWAEVTAIAQRLALPMASDDAQLDLAQTESWFMLGMLVLWGLLGMTRAALYHRRGIPVIVVDRQRTPTQIAIDLAAVICLLVWAYEVIAGPWQWRWHIGPQVLQTVLIESPLVKGVGAACVTMAVAIYAIALARLGKSWRLGIDRNNPGPLVTEGIYRWTRHPIYVAFDLLFLGTFLVLGKLVFVVLTIVWLPLMHATMLREERFLEQQYGSSYRDYCQRVGRYFSWGASARSSNGAD